MEPPIHETDENNNQTSPSITLAPAMTKEEIAQFKAMAMHIYSLSQCTLSMTDNQNLSTRNTRSGPTRPTSYKATPQEYSHE